MSRPSRSQERGATEALASENPPAQTGAAAPLQPPLSRLRLAGPCPWEPGGAARGALRRASSRGAAAAAHAEPGPRGTRARQERGARIAHGGAGRTPAGRHVLALLEAAVQLRQHLLALGVGEGVAEGKVGGGPAVLQEAVHEGQHELRLHHLTDTKRRLSGATATQRPSRHSPAAAATANPRGSAPAPLCRFSCVPGAGGRSPSSNRAGTGAALAATPARFAHIPKTSGCGPQSPGFLLAPRSARVPAVCLAPGQSSPEAQGVLLALALSCQRPETEQQHCISVLHKASERCKAQWYIVHFPGAGTGQIEHHLVPSQGTGAPLWSLFHGAGGDTLGARCPPAAVCTEQGQPRAPADQNQKAPGLKTTCLRPKQL